MGTRKVCDACGCLLTDKEDMVTIRLRKNDDSRIFGYRYYSKELHSYCFNKLFSTDISVIL